ncbi:MAG: hypothetical protein M3510_10325 [Actinomycetota bacterium]|nr:hypothetical protein [Actinomycetota bacterium]
MAEHLRHRGDLNTGGQPQGRGTVAEVVEADRPKPSGDCEPLERLRHIFGRQRLTALLREDKAPVDVRAPVFGPLAVLAQPMLEQGAGCTPVEFDGPVLA